MFRLLIAAVLLAAGLPPRPPNSSCSRRPAAYCARWNREIAPIYPKTTEGRRAPLRRVDVAAPRPADLAAIANVVYTPTFVLVEDGQEIGRIVGYSGDDFFWSHLADLFARLDRAKRPRPAPGAAPAN
ncbi:MAG: thioredoxin family protein [Alphaproteobacteria bacterium]